MIVNFLTIAFFYVFLPKKTFNKIESFKTLCENFYIKFLLLFLIFNLLGTPLTVGFFYKIIVFKCLVEKSLFIVLLGLLLNLIMIILYLNFLKKIKVKFKKLKLNFNFFENLNENLFFLINFFILLVSFCPIICLNLLEIIIILI